MGSPKWLHPGDTVEITGLQNRKELNGKQGELISWEMAKGRWQVALTMSLDGGRGKGGDPEHDTPKRCRNSIYSNIPGHCQWIPGGHCLNQDCSGDRVNDASDYKTLKLRQMWALTNPADASTSHNDQCVKCKGRWRTNIISVKPENFTKRICENLKCQRIT